MSRISFGTSGWRGIFCEEFTMENVRVVTQAIADHLRKTGKERKGSRDRLRYPVYGALFCPGNGASSGGIGNQIFPLQSRHSDPVIAYEILRRQAGGGINFTASHNPSDYNGLKFSPDWGGPALPETTRDIEERANAMLGEICYRSMPLDQAYEAGLAQDIDPRADYFEGIRKLIDFAAIGRSGMKIAVNTLYGTARGYLDELLREAGAAVVAVNDHPDPYFGGHPPEPAESHIGDFIDLVKNDPDIRLGLATDGDADRYGIVDADGTFYEPNYILALLLDYLVRVKKKNGDVARSVATSHFVDAVARHHGLQVFETPVGFKFIGEYIRDNRILIGGEESAGLTVRGHVPEKDGILACLLVAEMVAVTGKTLGELLADLYGRVGEFHTRRENIHLSSNLAEGIAGKLDHPPTVIGGRKIEQVITLDGAKFVFGDGSWMLFRKSGTEPVVRVYGEAGSAAELDQVMQAAAAFIHS